MVRFWLTNPAAWATTLYRISHWLWTRDLHLPAELVWTLSRVVSGVDIHPAAEIGPGLFIDHGVGLVIAGKTVIGEGCSLRQSTTIGGRPDEAGRLRFPRLGNRVFVGANVCIIGGITVGDDARIGAGAVVIGDVPAGWTAVGNPARVLPPRAERAGAASAGLG